MSDVAALASSDFEAGRHDKIMGTIMRLYRVSNTGSRRADRKKRMILRKSDLTREERLIAILIPQPDPVPQPADDGNTGSAGARASPSSGTASSTGPSTGSSTAADINKLKTSAIFRMRFSPPHEEGGMETSTMRPRM